MTKDEEDIRKEELAREEADDKLINAAFERLLSDEGV